MPHRVDVDDEPAARGAQARQPAGALRHALGLLALSALLAMSWRGVRRTHRRRRGSRSIPAPQRLQTWEGEGGRPDDPEPR